MSGFQTTWKCLILTAVLLPGTALAQFSTNIWPAWEHPRETEKQVWQCWSSVVERCWAQTYGWSSASAYSVPASPAWWRSTRANIIALKDSMGGLFINPGSLDGRFAKQIVDTTITGTNVIGWIVANSPSEYSLTNVPLITNKIHFLLKCQLPTNFFEYTPYRGLNGLGPFTDDATVGHPHGWTNSYTATGGTNFPPGRTNWYTTDYGIDGLRAVTNLLVLRDCNVIPASTGYRRGGGDYTDYGMGPGSFWTETITVATNGWPNIDNYNHTIQPMQKSIGTYEEYVNFFYYDCYVETKDVGISRKSGVSTNLTIPAPLAIYVVTNVTGSTNCTFDPLDTSFALGKNITTGTVSVVGATRVYDYGYTFTNPPPRYCDDPSTFSSHDSVLGWQGVDNTYWYITPEFKFR